MLELYNYIKYQKINKLTKKLNIVLIIIFIYIGYFSTLFINYGKYMNVTSFGNYQSYKDFLIINRFGNFSSHNISIIHQNSIFSLTNLNEKDNFIIARLGSSKIKNIFLLLAIFPYINKKSIIKCHFKTKSIYKLFKNIFDKKKSFSKQTVFNQSDFKYLLDNYYKLIYNKWERIPDDKFLKSTRYIINKYYNESFLVLFDHALNLNFKYYIQDKKSKFTFNEISILMSKLNYLWV